MVLTALLLAQVVLKVQDPLLSDKQLVDGRTGPPIHLKVGQPVANLGECARAKPFSDTPTNLSFGVSYYPPITVASAAGARVRRIVVQRSAPRSEGAIAWSEIVAMIRQVWAGKISEHSQYWSEANWWTFNATIEFEDRKTPGCLTTDGFHVSMTDAKGESWRFRLTTPQR